MRALWLVSKTWAMAQTCWRTGKSVSQVLGDRVGKCSPNHISGSYSHLQVGGSQGAEKFWALSRTREIYVALFYRWEERGLISRYRKSTSKIAVKPPSTAWKVSGLPPWRSIFAPLCSWVLFLPWLISLCQETLTSPLTQGKQDGGEERAMVTALLDTSTHMPAWWGHAEPRADGKAEGCPSEPQHSNGGEC
jgi:hypothetical protein